MQDRREFLGILTLARCSQRFCTVSSTLTAVGQTLALACDANPTKVMGSKCLLPRLQVMLDGYRKVDPPTRKRLPVQADVPELLVKRAYQSGTPQRQKETADLNVNSLTA